MSNSVVGGQVRGQALTDEIALACAAWEKDCQEPGLLRMYVAPVIGQSALTLLMDEEWVATLQEWEACWADEAYLQDFVLAYAEVATGLVAVG